MNHYHGVVPAVLTPFDADGALDVTALDRLLEHLLNVGVHGIFVAGTQGEFYALDDSEFALLVDTSVASVAGRVPVYAGVSAASTPQSLVRARLAAAAGADVIVSLPPLFPTPTKGEVLAHFRSLADTTDLPLFLYNHPLRTRVSFSVEMVVEMASIDHVCGIKDSSGDLALALQLREALPTDIAVFVGHDALIAYALIGGLDGAVAATANVAPEVAVGIWTAVREGRQEHALRLQGALADLRNAFALASGPGILREALTMLGRSVGNSRPPTERPGDEQRQALGPILERLEAVRRVDIGSMTGTPAVADHPEASEHAV